MSNALIYTDALGRVCVTHPGDKAPADLTTLAPPDATNVRVIDATSLPARDEFRNAWAVTGGTVAVDLAKAKAIATADLDRALRREAQSLLVRETLGENVAADKTRLQAVNPTTMTAGAASIAQLKAAWPSWLAR